jgi:copper transport protein
MPRSNRWTLAGLVAALLLLALLPPGVAHGHAALVSSTPVAGATLESPPPELVIAFTEELDPGFTRVQLFNARGQLVNAGPGTIDPSDPLVLRLELDELPRDSYTAVWRARSMVDGHVTEGNVPFGVGVAAPRGSLIPPPGAPEPATLPPPPLEATGRWLSLLAAALAFGGLLFAPLVWRPVARSAAWSAPADEALTRAIRRLVVVGGVLLLLASTFLLLTQAANAAGFTLAQALGEPFARMVGTRTGLLWAARAALVVVAMLLAFRLPLAGRGHAAGWWLGAALAAAVALTFALSSHAAALPEGAALAVALGWLHTLAMFAWIGGLVPLLAALRATGREGASPLVARFSRLALASVATLTLTGVYAANLHVGAAELLAGTTYGRALAVKLALFVGLVALGALNLLLLIPRLRRGGGSGGLRRSVRAEVVLGAMVLLVVGVLTSVAPARTAWEEQQRLGQSQAATVGDVEMVLRVAPAWIGDNEFAVDVTDRRPGAEGAPTEVLLDFGMEGMEMGELRAEAQPAEARRYVTRGSYVAMGGRWQVEVLLRRAGFDDVRHTFVLDILRSPTVQ